VAFRNTATHVLARSLDEKSIQDSLRAGRSFVSHDWLCDATGFTFAGGNNLGVYQMGDSLPMASGTRLKIATPVAATLRVIYKGKTIARKTADRLTVPVTEPGAYRAEAWLEVDGELRPWIYSNPIYVEKPDPTSMQLPSGELAANVEAVRDLLYVESSTDEKHKLDIYRPRGAAKRPVLFFVHGGAWRNGDRRLYPALGNRIAREDYVVVVPSYRLAPKNLWPAQIDDVSAAFAWTVRNIAQYGGDPNRIVLAGQSAGGHLVSLLATRSKDAKAVVSVSGVYRIGSGMGVFGDDPAVRADASPLTHVHAGLPPFVVAYCQWDYLTLPQQAEAFHEALKGAGNVSQLIYIPQENHISEVLRVTEPDNLMARTFLDTLRRVDNQ
jgi:acetyl esterase/lipase